MNLFHNAEPECGRANLELGSSTAPWIAAIGAFRNSIFEVSCSGTILSRSLVVTTAHCLDDSVGILPLYVRVGVTRSDQAGAQDRRIKEVINHPDRNKNNWYYDVALLVLEKELTFSERVSSLCLPERPSTHPGIGETILVQGWEDDKDINGLKVSEAPVTVRSRQECDIRYNSAGLAEVRAFIPKLTNSVLLCADAALDAQQGVCYGDSGGPAFYR